jgi:hypothetical protein
MYVQPCRETKRTMHSPGLALPLRFREIDQRRSEVDSGDIRDVPPHATRGGVRGRSPNRPAYSVPASAPATPANALCPSVPAEVSLRCKAPALADVPAGQQWVLTQYPGWSRSRRKLLWDPRPPPSMRNASHMRNRRFPVPFLVPSWTKREYRPGDRWSGWTVMSRLVNPPS